MQFFRFYSIFLFNIPKYDIIRIAGRKEDAYAGIFELKVGWTGRRGKFFEHLDEERSTKILL